jgi:DNA repair protein RAD16
VLSSYGTLEAAFRRQQNGFKKGNTYIKQKSPMHEFEWFRLDSCLLFGISSS